MSTVIPESSSPAQPPSPPPAPGARSPRGRPGRPASRARIPAVGALLLALLAVIYLATRSHPYHYNLDFSDAGQLVTGDMVRVGGTQAGTVDSIRLTDRGLAQIGIALDHSFGPLHQGTTAVIRSPGLASIASRYVDLSPASPLKPALPDGATIASTDTSGIVDIDQVFDALDASTRTGLRQLVRGFASWYQGKGAQANATSTYFPPALQSYTHLFDQLDADTPTLDRFISQTSAALGAIDSSAPQLTDLIGQAETTAQALSSDNSSLTEALTDLPGALNSGSATFARLRKQALPALSKLIDATRPVTAPLSQFLPKLNPVLQAAMPVFSLLSQIFDKPGPNNDLYDALVGLPQLGKEVKADFPEAIKALHESTPIFEFARPYIPDLVGWISNWDGIFAPYDANGHYARTVPALDAFTFTANGEGGTLTQTPPYARGQSSYVKTGNLQRCPGSAVIPPADGSAPYVDSGSLSNSHCNPSQAIGAAK